MKPDRESSPGSLAVASDSLPTALRNSAIIIIIIIISEKMKFMNNKQKSGQHSPRSRNRVAFGTVDTTVPNATLFLLL